MNREILFKVLVMFWNKKEKCTQEIMGTSIKKNGMEMYGF